MSSALVIGLFVAASLALYEGWRAIERARAHRALERAGDVAMLGPDIVPASIHPVVDPNRCIGSGGCVEACPEKEVLGLVRGRAQLLNPLACVGHGACAAACPMGAIQLVFGSETRGVELPALDPDFQTARPGVYIIGELSGMGLIRNAVSQGRDAARTVAAGARRGGAGASDAIVVGAGPAGIAATLALIEAGLSVVLLEREEFGGTIRHYPRHKVVMTGAFDLPGFGRVQRRTMSKEELLDLWDRIRASTGLPVVTGENVEGLAPDGDGTWIVRSTGGERRAASVLLALGRRGTPKKLGVPGEHLPKVVYRVIEPEVFRGQRVLVVGGGNAAAENAIALAEQGECLKVALSYRRPELARLRGEVRERFEPLVAAGRVATYLPSEVESIGRRTVTLRDAGGARFTLDNDAVVVQIGGTSPGDVLRTFGIETVVKYGEA